MSFASISAMIVWNGLNLGLAPVSNSSIRPFRSFANFVILRKGQEGSLCRKSATGHLGSLLKKPFPRSVLRSFIIMGGCRLVIHMRKQVFRQQSTSDTAVSTSIRFGVPDSDERHHHWTKSRAISIAQQIGLPPPTAEMASMWPESEADSIGTDSSSPANGDILLRPLGPDQGHSDTDAPSSVYVPAPGSGATLALPV